MARRKDEYKDSHVIKQVRRNVNGEVWAEETRTFTGILHTCLYVWKFSQ